MAIPTPKWLVIAALVTLAPDTPGVLELWDGDELVYVGGTSRKETLRSKLEHELAAHSADATHFSCEITFNPEARIRQLLAEFEREHHRVPRFNSG